MSFEILETETNGTIIKVVGVGGAGGNAVEHMIRRGVGGVEFICANTDHQALARSSSQNILQLGKSGLGAGSRPEAGRQAADEARDRIADSLRGAHMVFITAGMGGGTGTGAAPVFAEVAKELGILTVAVVSKPFEFEGPKRLKLAEAGLSDLEDNVDSLIVILNNKLEEVMGEDAEMAECFRAADDVLHNACAGIAEIINVPGLVNVDFEDVKTVMSERGKAMMGTATSSGLDRARIAAEQAVASPLLEGVDLSGARGVLVNITASSVAQDEGDARGDEHDPRFRRRGLDGDLRHRVRRGDGRSAARDRRRDRPRPRVGEEGFDAVHGDPDGHGQRPGRRGAGDAFAVARVGLQRPRQTGDLAHARVRAGACQRDGGVRHGPLRHPGIPAQAGGLRKQVRGPGRVRACAPAGSAGTSGGSRVVLVANTIADDFAVGMPGGMADPRNGDDEAKEEGGEAESDDEDDQGGPQQQRPGVGQQGPDARQRGDDRVRSAVEHHRHGHDADGKDDRGEDAADCEVGEEEVEMIGTDHLAEEVLQASACRPRRTGRTSPAKRAPRRG